MAIGNKLRQRAAQVPGLGSAANVPTSVGGASGMLEGSYGDAIDFRPEPLIGTDIDYAESESEHKADNRHFRIRLIICYAIVIVLFFIGTCMTGNQETGETTMASLKGTHILEPYSIYSIIDVFRAIYAHLYNLVAATTHLFNVLPDSVIDEEYALYYMIEDRMLTMLVVAVCGALLVVSGMLYQTTFKNPIAGPGMLGASSGASLGIAILAICGATSVSMLAERYLITYGFGAAMLILVLLAGWKLSARGKTFDIVSMMLIGAITGQLIGAVVQVLTLFVMSNEAYMNYYEMNQLQTVDVSLASLIVLAVAVLASFLPIFFMRHQMNALSLEEEEVRLLGMDYTRIRIVALVCGAFMILTAQVHIGAVGLVTVVIPFVARSIFGCEFSKQLGGSVALGMAFVLVCKIGADAIPFVGDGLSVGNLVCIVVLPLFIYIMSTKSRGWQ